MSNPYQLLKVAETADDDAIHAAYLRQVRAFPPDREPERFQAVRQAYEAIRTYRDRLRYRLFGTEPPPLTQLLDLTPRAAGRRPDAERLRQVLVRSLGHDPARR